MSQFRNLLHHHVHRSAAGKATTFWAGLGAIRREAFESCGGFDAELHPHAMEDVELGMRLSDAGARIVLDPALRGKHLIDLLLLDEVHEALDHEFRAVVAERAEAIRARGGIVVAAGHDHATLASLCERAVRLADGAVVADGAFGDVVDGYAPRRV